MCQGNTLLFGLAAEFFVVALVVVLVVVVGGGLFCFVLREKATGTRREWDTSTFVGGCPMGSPSVGRRGSCWVIASLRRVCALGSRRGQPLLLVIVWTVPAAAAGGCPRPGTCVWWWAATALCCRGRGYIRNSSCLSYPVAAWGSRGVLNEFLRLGVRNMPPMASMCCPEN